MNNRAFHFLQLGLSILIMSSSGVLGRIISLPVPTTIWIRCALGALALYLFLKITKSKTFLGWERSFKFIFASSIFMGAHWLTYFWALKYSNVAIGMLSLFTYPVITAVLEPLLTKTKFKLPDLILAGIAFTGVFFLVPEYNLENQVTLGIIFGISSAVLYSLRNIMMKKSVSNHSGVLLMYYQLAIIAVLLLPSIFLFPFEQQMGVFKLEWFPIVILALYTTATGHTLLVKSFRHFSITAVSIFTCLTPLFGIFQAYLFINEKPTNQILIGGSIIMFSVIVESIRSINRN
ncbi:MAG: DMT family transporter [Reichenbachiella sp.]